MGELEKMALISDALEQLYPKSDIGVYVILDKESFDEKKQTIENIDTEAEQFSINISGVDFFFILSKDE